jgi:hypothetical protein
VTAAACNDHRCHAKAQRILDKTGNPHRAPPETERIGRYARAARRSPIPAERASTRPERARAELRRDLALEPCLVALSPVLALPAAFPAIGPIGSAARAGDEFRGDPAA